MKKSLLSAAIAVGLLTGCAHSLPIGSLYTSVKLPVSATANSQAATKKGTAQCTSILGLFATGDASIESAKQNGGITKVTHVDYDANNVLGLYGKYTVTVYGE